MRASGRRGPPPDAELIAFSVTNYLCLRISSFVFVTPDVTLAAKGTETNSKSAGISAAGDFAMLTCLFVIGGITMFGGNPPTEPRPSYNSLITASGASYISSGKFMSYSFWTSSSFTNSSDDLDS